MFLQVGKKEITNKILQNAGVVEKAMMEGEAKNSKKNGENSLIKEKE